MQLLINQHLPTEGVVIVPVLQDQNAIQLQHTAEVMGLSPELLQLECKSTNGEKNVFFNANHQKIILLGLGKEPKPAELIKTFRTLFQAEKTKLTATTAVWMPSLPAEWAEYVVNGAELAQYDLGLYKTEAKETRTFGGESSHLHLVVAAASTDTATAAAQRGQVTAQTQRRIMDLVNAPANHKTPETLADWALQSGQQHGYGVTVLDAPQIKSTGLHALLAVSRGSANEPRFLILDHQPTAATRTVVLVGKGVTFDTGGISMKSSTNMHYMKSDMGGAAAVLGTVELAAQLQLPIRVVGLIPTTENSVDAHSTKPGDVIDSYAGKTIEVIDTDAEGRLILADGLAYALKHYQPDVLIDLATLTGSVVQTLGYAAAGLFTNNDQLAQQLSDSGAATGEKVWRLPLWDDYRDELKSDVADLKNYHGKPIAGAIVAAKFLEAFTENHPAWAHLDIAGTAFGDSGFASMKSATAYGVRLLIDYLNKAAER